MKHLIFNLLLFVSFKSVAQTCQNFYFFKPGAVVETSLFDKKGKPDGKTVCAVKAVENTSTGKKSSFVNTVLSESGKKQTEVKGTAQCQEGNLMLDLRNFVNEDQMKAFKDMEVRSAEAYLEYPSLMTVGAALPDGVFHMDVFNSGNSFGSVDVTVKNRKVVGKEDVTSPAGTWSCYKITYTSVVKTMMMGIGFPIEMLVTEWYAPGFGVFKTETYSTKGKLMGSSLVTSVK
jgi:hypothetical protein